MVYVSTVNKKSVKITLNSDRRSYRHADTLEDSYILGNPLTQDQNEYGVVNVEKMYFRAPSLLNDQTIYDSQNVFKVTTNDVDVADTLTNLQTDLALMKNEDLTDSGSFLFLLGRLLKNGAQGGMEMQLQCHNVTDGYINFKPFAAQGYAKTWSGNSDGSSPQTSAYGQIQNPFIAARIDGSYYLLWEIKTNTVANTGNPNFLEPNLYAYLDARLQKMQHFIVTVALNHEIYNSSTQTITADANTNHTMTIKGSLLKLFGWNDEDSVTLSSTDNSTKTGTIAVTGYNVLNIHSNLTRTNMFNQYGSTALTNSNLLYTVHVADIPGSDVFIITNGLGGLPFSDNLIENINIYFTDAWGDHVLLDKYDVTLLVNNESTEGSYPEPTPKRPRNELLRVIGN